MFGFYLLSSPISGVLINKFGCRIVCIAGCIIGALGIGLSSLSPNVAILMLTYGVVGGYGLGTMYLPSMVVISDYFEKKRGLATGKDFGKTLLADVNKIIVFKSLLTTPSNILPLHLKQTFPPIILIFNEGDVITSRLPFKIFTTLTGIADSGSGVGILVFAPLTTVLLEAYGWKGTHLVFGGLTLGSILFASLMGPIVSKCQPNLKEENKQVHKKVQIHPPNNLSFYSSEIILDWS